MSRRLLRACGALAAGGALLLAGCSGSDGERPDGGGGAGGKAGPTSGTSAPPHTSPNENPSPGTSQTPTTPTASAAPTGPDFTPDPSRAPRTTADAGRLALAIVAGPDAWGPDYVKRTPFLSDPGTWPVLDANCTWGSGPRPRTVLSSVTAYSEIPAAGGRGALRVAATVTVHRTESDADWEMAETLEEALRCPAQRLRQGERVTDLMSLGSPYGVGGNTTSTDSLTERGTYLADAFKGRQFYSWFQSRIGQVTVATVVKGAPGYTETDTNPAQVRANVTMQERIKAELGAQS
ncbi:hypothetical protein ACFY7C_29660 [Streptomyces sp. NPDC012769]|uniref:hypothetical protein n=1 Tax=Streptomyces sp. NPDC012769 TaxID=3364848 RepID=UPI0036D03A60